MWIKSPLSARCIPAMTLTPADIFECALCGECCKGYGGTHLTHKDINRIAAYLEVDAETVVATHCCFSGATPMISQGSDGRCRFWDQICTIHPVKPRMCRAWPFLKSVLIDVQNWHSMARSCPGMRTDIPDALIQECVARVIDDQKS